MPPEFRAQSQKVSLLDKVIFLMVLLLVPALVVSGIYFPDQVTVVWVIAMGLLVRIRPSTWRGLIWVALVMLLFGAVATGFDPGVNPVLRRVEEKYVCEPNHALIIETKEFSYQPGETMIQYFWNCRAPDGSLEAVSAETAALVRFLAYLAIGAGFMTISALIFIVSKISGAAQMTAGPEGG